MDNKQNKARIDRILYVSMVLILCALAIVIAITSSVNRARKDRLETTSPADTTLSPVSTSSPVTRPAPDTTKDKPTELDTPETTDAPETTGSSLVLPGDGNYDDVDLPAPALPSFSVPVSGSISKPHDDSSAVYSVTMGDYRVHLGVDIACNDGDAVSAAAPGTVSQIWDDPLMGRCVSISHTGGGLSIYKNLDPEMPDGITVGASVDAGDTIGSVGESALIEIAEEPHLHFELTVGGVHVDPMEYFDHDSVSASLDADLYE